jgi:hypothetical protein
VPAQVVEDLGACRVGLQVVAQVRLPLRQRLLDRDARRPEQAQRRQPREPGRLDSAARRRNHRARVRVEQADPGHFQAAALDRDAAHFAKQAFAVRGVNDGLVGLAQRGIQAIQAHDLLMRLVEFAHALLKLRAAFLQLVDQHFVVDLQRGRLADGRLARRVRRLRERLQHLAHLGDQDLGLGRLDQEGVGSHVERQLLVLRIGVGGCVHHEGDAAQRAVGLPLAQQRVAVHARHQQIADDHPGRTGARGFQRLDAVLGLLDFVAVPLQQHVAMVFAVVDDQDAHYAAPPVNRSTSPTKVSGSIGFSI